MKHAGSRSRIGARVDDHKRRASASCKGAAWTLALTMTSEEPEIMANASVLPLTVLRCWNC